MDYFGQIMGEMPGTTFPSRALFQWQGRPFGLFFGLKFRVPETMDEISRFLVFTSDPLVKTIQSSGFSITFSLDLGCGSDPLNAEVGETLKFRLKSCHVMHGWVGVCMTFTYIILYYILYYIILYILLYIILYYIL